MDLLRQDGDAFLKFKEISNAQEIAISVLLIFELWIGVSLCDNNLKERQRILNVIGNLKIFDLNRQSAEMGINLRLLEIAIRWGKRGWGLES